MAATGSYVYFVSCMPCTGSLLLVRYYNLRLVCGAKTSVRDILDVSPPLSLIDLIVWDDCNQRNV